MFGTKKRKIKGIKTGPLAAAFGIEWQTKKSFSLGGHTFNVPSSMLDFLMSEEEVDPSTFYLAKTLAIIQCYLTLFNEKKRHNILELGIFRGGSTAFLQLLGKPERLLALELSPERIGILDQFIAGEKLDGSVRVEYGVSQDDIVRVRELTIEHFGPGRSIDVVVDDASHLLAPTRTSFETVFPLIRPGGSYIVEDYAGSQIALDDWLEPAVQGNKQFGGLVTQSIRSCLQADYKPLLLLAVEAMLVSIVAPGVVQKVVTDRHWLKIVRGPDDIEDPASFDLRALAIDHFGLLDSKPSENLARFLD
jgi:predicted O-methyltransferase YrrM